MTERMYNHMKNTINDICVILKRDSMADSEKVKYIKMSIGLLESVQCGENVIDEKIERKDK